MQITLDPFSGFCFGVDAAISRAEKLLEEGHSLYSLGEVVHNRSELNRLTEKGLHVISRSEFPNLRGAMVLIRAHGEPPETLSEAEKYGIRLLDATCPVVAKLQQRIRKSFQSGNGTQIVIYGKEGHAEVIGLSGQTGHTAIIVNDTAGLEQIDFTKPVELYAQTTMNQDGFTALASVIRERMKETGNVNLIIHNTLCRQVAGRVPELKQFAANHDVIVFVSGSNSSNGTYLFKSCREVNPRSYFISSLHEIERTWFTKNDQVGISGATSTPSAQLEEVADYIRNLFV